MMRRRMHEFAAISPSGLTVTVKAHLMFSDSDVFILRNDRGMNIACFPKSWCIIQDTRYLVDIQKPKEQSIQSIRRNLIVEETLDNE
jgi:hypothetical protein